jgi:hypothetical protein
LLEDLLHPSEGPKVWEPIHQFVDGYLSSYSRQGGLSASATPVLTTWPSSTLLDVCAVNDPVVPESAPYLLAIALLPGTRLELEPEQSSAPWVAYWPPRKEPAELTRSFGHRLCNNRNCVSGAVKEAPVNPMKCINWGSKLWQSLRPKRGECAFCPDSNRSAARHGLAVASYQPGKLGFSEILCSTDAFVQEYLRQHLITDRTMVKTSKG